MAGAYNPIPPRAWFRVQSQCTYIVPDSSYSEAYIPLTGQTVSQAQADYEGKLLYKGNILQYKGNSAQLTKKQRYSQLATGSGPNRKKVFATQTQTYSNPNMTGLLRVNYTTYTYPNQIVGAPNNPSGPFQYNVQSPYDCSNNSVQDGGALVCGTYANPCSGQIIQQHATPQYVCNPSYCSDVPGRPIDLCWTNKAQTWFPRQRYVMPTSANKWPEGYKGFRSAIVPGAPVLTYVVDSSNSAVSLSWTIVPNCSVPISSYQVYQNGALIQTLSYAITSVTINGLISGNTYSFYVVALSNGVASSPSNVVTLTA